MKTVLLIVLLLFVLYAYPQGYSLNKHCIYNNWIEIDTCVVNNDTVLVLNHEEYVIKIRCLGVTNSMVHVRIVEVLKRTEYPVLGYNHVICKTKIDELVRELKSEFGDNRSRVLPLFYVKNDKHRRNGLVLKNDH